MCRVTLLHRYRISTALSGLNIYRGQPEILGYLIENGECSQKNLADSMGVSSASVATSIKRMCKAGLVERAEDESDRRINRIRITEKGREVFAVGRENCNKVDSEMFKGFSESEIDEFSDFLQRITENLSADGLSEKEVFEYFAAGDGRKGDDKNA
jgi:DNA-binding MarR family transcriptional regulator